MCLACTVPYESAPEGTGKLTSLGVLTSEGFRSHKIVLLGSGYRPFPLCTHAHPAAPIMTSGYQMPFQIEDIVNRYIGSNESLILEGSDKLKTRTPENPIPSFKLPPCSTLQTHLP
jgi:hypothetical protein